MAAAPNPPNTPNQPNQAANQPTQRTPKPEELEKIRKYLEDSNLEITEINNRMRDLVKGGADFERELANAYEHFKKLSTKFDDIRETWQNVISDMKKANQETGQIDKSFKSLSSMAEKLSYHQQDIGRLSLSELETMKKKAQQNVDNLRLQRNILVEKLGNIDLEAAAEGKIRDANGEVNVELMEQAKRLLEIADQIDENGELIDNENNYIKQTLDFLEEQYQKQKKINETMATAGAIVTGITSSLQKLGIRSEFFENLKDDMEKAAESGSKWKVLTTGLTGVLKGIGNAMRDPVVVLGLAYKAVKGLYDLVVQYESKLFDMSKSLGVSLSHTTQLFEKFRGIAINNNQLAVTGKQIAEHYAQINNSLGFMGPISEEFLTTSLGIQRRTGATAEDMQNMALFSKATGKTLEQTYATVIGSAKATAAQNNFMMTEKQIMEGISKTSATVFNNFKGNVKQIADAVVQATKLGTSLDQINQAGMQMLNFEDSISKEFEAQLLTGKNLDLSRARQYALTGKTQDLMKEMSKQLGSQAEWGKMNVIQQQSLAEALGMSKEAVDEMFKKQRLVNELGDLANSSTRTQYETLRGQHKTHDEIAKLLGNEAADSAKQASVQEQMAVVMENLRDSFAKLSEAFLPVVKWFAGVISDADTLKRLIYAIGAGTLAIVGYSIYITREKQKQAASMAQNVATQTQLMGVQVALTKAAREEAIAKQTSAKASGQDAVITTASIPNDLKSAGAAVVESVAKGGAAVSGPTAGLGTIPMMMSILGVIGIAAAAYGLSGFGGGGGSSAAAMPATLPSSDMNASNPAATGGGEERKRPLIQSVANERPIYVKVQTQVVDTAANISGRIDRGVYPEKTSMN